jgi:CRP-like cAMP-binding protein
VLRPRDLRGSDDHPRYRDWLGRVVRLGVAPRPRASRPSLRLAPERQRVINDQIELSDADLSPLSFWAQLNPVEQEEFRSVAHPVKFGIGDRLMQEGEPADFVIVILQGHTKICVDENGWERGLAERGPGDLVGEGGMQRDVRSASVIAMEPVRGLMAKTDDFGNYANSHPRVLGIVASHLNDRIIEGPAVDREHYRLATVSVTNETRRPDTTWSSAPVPADHVQPPPLSGQNCTILLTDVVAFGSSDRNDEDRRAIREALFGMTRMMLQGIPDVRSEDRGDGLLTVVPPDIPTANVMERLVEQLLPTLTRSNSVVRDSARFQLRAAISVGPVTSDIMGISGEAIIIAARLVDAPIFKEAIAETAADLGIIVSSFVYETVIRHNRSLEDYYPVQVTVKGFSNPAWVRLFSPSLVPSYLAQPVISDPIGALGSYPE